MTKAELIEIINDLNDNLKKSLKNQRQALLLMSKKFVSADIAENREALMMLGGILSMLDVQDEENETQV